MCCKLAAAPVESLKPACYIHVRPSSDLVRHTPIRTGAANTPAARLRLRPPRWFAAPEVERGLLARPRARVRKESCADAASCEAACTLEDAAIAPSNEICKPRRFT